MKPRSYELGISNKKKYPQKFPPNTHGCLAPKLLLDFQSLVGWLVPTVCLVCQLNCSLLTIGGCLNEETTPNKQVKPCETFVVPVSV